MRETEESRQKKLLEFGVALAQVGHSLMGRRDLEVDIVGMSLRGPRTEGEEILMTVRGLSGDGTPVVTFLSGGSLGALFVSFESAIRAGKLKWRPDQYRMG